MHLGNILWLIWHLSYSNLWIWGSYYRKLYYRPFNNSIWFEFLCYVSELHQYAALKSILMFGWSNTLKYIWPKNMENMLILMPFFANLLGQIITFQYKWYSSKQYWFGLSFSKIYLFLCLSKIKISFFKNNKINPRNQ